MRLTYAWLIALVACGRVGFDGKQSPIEPVDGDVTGDGARPIDGGPGDGAGVTCTGGSPGCAQNEYCSTPLGMCNGQGTCRVIPTQPGTCTDILVCGCNGQIYPNGCAAAAAGQSIASIGNCAI